jgi:hypothetical protein
MKVILYWFARVSILTFALMLVFTEAKADVWNADNDPSQFDLNHTYHYKLSDLPLSAQMKTTPWSETYWPAYKGSVNVRWNTPDQDGFNYTPPTHDQVVKMSADDLSHLSPAEKYDLYMGHYDYPLWNEVKHYADPTADQYTGMCDGWSIAAIQYAEPKQVTLANPDGILIPFGSSDVKALMTFAAEFHFERQEVQVGVACTTSTPTTPDQISACSGMNPGAMHVILANQIGLQQIAFITERKADDEDWNQPVFGYTFQTTGSAISTVPGAQGVVVHGILNYTEDLDASYVQPVVGTSNFHANKIVMDYVLDVDAQGNIIGGTWASGSDRPGYFWFTKNHLDFTGELLGIQKIYQANAK